MRRISIILFILVFLGCTRKDLYYGAITHPGEIIISADWGETENVPGGIVAYLYSEEGSADTGSSEPTVEYVSNIGSTISLPYGSYYGFIFNDYTEDVLFRNMDDRQSAEAYLGRTDESPFSTRSPETKHIGCLESFYKVQIENFTLTKDSRSHSATVNPKLKTLSIELIVSLEGSKNIAYARGALSGVNDAINLSTGNPNTNNTANVVFDFNIADNTISASIKCFGINNLGAASNGEIEIVEDNNLEIAFILKDGSQIIGEHIFDITDIISELAPVENDGVYEDVLIELDKLGIIIPDVPGSGDGFDLEVGDWDDPIIEELH